MVTAHRNRSARHDDLDHLYQDANRAEPHILAGATVMIGIAEWYLNVADEVKGHFEEWRVKDGKRRKVFVEERFDAEVLPRLKDHDVKLMDDFIGAVSHNTPQDILASFRTFRTLPVRSANKRDTAGYDGLLLVPVHYDNINPVRVARENPFGIDVDEEYVAFIKRFADDYTFIHGKGPGFPPPGARSRSTPGRRRPRAR